MKFDKKLYFETKFIILDEDIKLPNDFIIITAENPFHSDKTTKIANILLNHKLEKELISLGYNFSKILGCSANLQHSESSYLLELTDFNLACNLGLKYKQESIFIVKDGVLYYSDCNKDTRKLNKIGVFAAKIIKATTLK